MKQKEKGAAVEKGSCGSNTVLGESGDAQLIGWVWLVQQNSTELAAVHTDKAAPGRPKASWQKGLK